MKQSLEIDACRRARPYTKREYIARVMWALAQPLFQFSPRPCFAWRRWILRLFGGQIGQDVHIYPSSKIYLPWNLDVRDKASIGEWVLVYNLGPVTIGAGASISHRAHLCAGTHDYQDPTLPLQRLPIVIGPRAWVCADAFVGPGVTVGEGAVIAARAVVVRDVPAWHVVGGNPARKLKVREMKS